ncbi:hypothetical protein G4B88_010288 [Cannabis sativa]|uniref:CCHC-type domain-containing protein n=1 Tax=Cannabis sativa TaxID=3483 RepID=A0A7J6I696_CANSA|nr:hypothetical protein G4B88_010288 [Cannabis sativa]
MDEILQKTHNLQVTDEDEEWEVDKSLSITVAKSNLRGRLCTNTDHSRGFLKKVLGGIWRLKDVEWNLKIKEKFDTGLFLTFTFASESIQSRILSKMPWYLSNGVLILGKMENSNESWKHDLTSFPIWGRAWDVPIDLLTINNTVRMAAKAGEVITVHNSDVSKMVADGFFRFRIWMSINKLVCPGFPLPYKGTKKWITFQYEELPFMCFKCGKIGHSYKDCHQNPTLIQEEGKEGTAAYGKWLKVGNGTREGMQGDRQGMGKNNSIDETMQQSPINTGRTTTASSSPSLTTMGDARSGSMKGTENRDTNHGQEQQLIEGGLKSTPKNHDSKAGDMGKEEIQRRNDDGNKGKRRIVEDYGDLGYGKLKKSTTDLSKDYQDHELYNIPVSYAHEARVLDGSTPFVVGSCSKNIAKENRRKVAVKKDSKARKGKLENKRHNTTRWRTRFHFESAWAEDEECSNIVQSVWQQDKKISNTRELQNRLGKWICWGRKILKEGARWRVGNGRKIKVWEDKWLPRPHESTLSKFPDIPPQTKLHKFITWDGEWNREEMTKHFHEDDIPWIQGIPIDLYMEDDLIWPFTPNGQDNVKSGYEETLTHALWSCDRVRNIWKLFSWYKNCSNLGEGTMFDVLMAIEQTTTRCEFEDTIKVMWAIWENRNRKWKQLPSMNGQQLINWIFSAYLNVLKAENDVVHQEAGLTINQKQWIPPANGCICVNCDAAVIDKVAGVGLGFIWRKADGQILSAGQIYMKSICSAKMAEAWAILEALKNPPADASNQIEVQIDCRVLVEEINNRGQHLSAESNLLYKIHNVLDNFQNADHPAMV